MHHQLSALDWSWIVAFILIAFGMAVYHARLSSRSIEHYFVAGRQTRWWVLGTSIVATTFAADTPLVICGLVITQGISGNWYWWAVVPSGMLGVFFFAKLWQRSGCLTQAEFTIVRYGPKRAKTLRLFYVFYHGVLRNAVTLGFVNLAMAKIIALCTPLGEWQALGICFVLTVLYTILGGINGIMWTDFLQFFLALGSAVAIAHYAVQGIGGWEQLRNGLLTIPVGGTADAAHAATAYLPPLQSSAGGAFFIFVSVYWVACTSTDCNGYAVQRLLSAKDEQHAIWGYLWFNVAHYVLRSWPWIVVGLVAALTFSAATGDRAEAETEYINILFRFSPKWLIGPALASLLAAYMSTVDTHLNWGASYAVNDFYAPYISPGRSKRHYVVAGHIATAMMAALGIAATALMSSIIEGWGLVYGLLSGMGIVGILRWLWWRVTAWTELGCMLTAGATTIGMHLGFPSVEFPFTLLVIVPMALLGAIIGTFAFKPEPREVLVHFFNKVTPPGPGWSIPTDLPPSPSGPTGFQVTAHKAVGEHPSAVRHHATTQGLLKPTMCWLMGTASIYCAMFGIGDLLLKSKARGEVLCAIGLTLAVAVGLVALRGASVADRPGRHET